MLEKMSEFFENRLDGYDEHMLTNIAFAAVFYPFTADCLPKNPNCRILDLGCGTGLELEYYFDVNPSARVTGIDLSEKMLNALREKFPNKVIQLIQGSYFAIPLGIAEYDAAVSVESLHHFTKAEKIPLYAKLHDALKENGYFILTDYFAYDEEDERNLYATLLKLKNEQGIADNEFYHFDTPLTVDHEIEALTEAGFSTVEILGHWENTYTLKAAY